MDSEKKQARIKSLRSQIEGLEEELAAAKIEVAAARRWHDEMIEIGGGISLGPGMDGYIMARRKAEAIEAENRTT